MAARTRRLLPFALWAVLPLVPPAARAGEGRIELNHLRALSGDASLGDQAGYPVTLRAGTSFVLTGALTPPTKTNAIEIQGHGVHIDLNGHTIAGTTCVPGACTPAQDAGISIAANVEGASIANGSIRGFGGDCLRLGASARVHDLHVSDCGEDGIEVGAGSEVYANTVDDVGRHGIHFSAETGTYAENVVFDAASSDPGGVSVFRGSARRGNLCDDGRCSTRAARRYYLTTTTAPGDEVLAECAPGFHVASALELRDTTQLEYAFFLGDVEADSGRGPVANNSGWVRSGSSASPTYNCNNWTTGDASAMGLRIILRFPNNWDLAGTQLAPWHVSNPTSCGSETNVWCIED